MLKKSLCGRLIALFSEQHEIEHNRMDPNQQNQFVHSPPAYNAQPTYQPNVYQPPTYQVSPQQPLLQPQHGYQNQTVIHVSTDAPAENNCCLGFWMSFFFSFFGLLCMFCVRDKSSYLKGWLVPFLISLVVGALILILAGAGVIVVHHTYY